MPIYEELDTVGCVSAFTAIFALICVTCPLPYHHINGCELADACLTSSGQG